MNIGGGINIGGGVSIRTESSLSYVTAGLLFNLDMQNYVSGTTWPDNSGNGNNFTFYQAPTGSSYCLLYTSPSPRD